MTSTSTRSSKSARLGLRATLEQEAVLRKAAAVANKSLTQFILDSAYQAAEQTLLDQKLFLVDENQYQDFLTMLDEPPKENEGIKALFGKPAPWDE